MSSDKTKGRVLLPSHVLPIRYDIELTPDLNAFTFDGKVEIEFEVTEELNESNHKSITLHAKELLFEKAWYVVSNNEQQEQIQADEIKLNVKATTVEFVFATPITSDIKLTILYKGFLNNQMAGFYRSSYKNIKGESKIMASTQFEALDARRAFPCVDEPARKAVFGVTLTIPNRLTCFSNMPEKERLALNETRVRVSFLDSPKMSTYLVAFCVGEFDRVSDLTLSGILVTVYTPPGKSESGRFALDCATRVLELYNDFFGIPYPLPKMDMVAIPEFAQGAMENWGLVTYREVDILIDPLKASNRQKQRVGTVVAHELAHQWFGNLVTMAWWDDLWLNEGFASWCEVWACDRLYPSWRMKDQDVVDGMAHALRLDALQSSHPIQVPIGRAEEVEQVFDAISYCKGSAVIRMIRAALGKEPFRKGLQSYMKKHAYSNTETTDLWNAWETASGLPEFRSFVKSWTEQMGFPLLRVIKDTWYDDRVVLELDQIWFLSDGSQPKNDKLWTIPIMTRNERELQSEITMMREKTATITIPTKSWIKLNAGQDVPIRVLPSTEMTNRSKPAIASKSLPTCDRAALVSDAYALVKASYLPPERLLKLLAMYITEDEFVVWDELAACLNGLDTMMEEDSMEQHLRDFARKMVLPLMEKIGWDNKDDDGHLTVLLRSTLIGLSSRFAYNDPAVAEEAQRRFDAFLKDPNDMKTLPSSMRTTVFKIVLKNNSNDDNVYNQIKSYYSQTTDNAEQQHVLGSIGNTPNLKLKQDALEWAISGDVKLQDCFYPMASVSRSSKEGRQVAWTFFKEKLPQIKTMLRSASPSMMSSVVVCCAGGFVSNQQADELEAFFKKHPLPHCDRKIAQVVESTRANAKFVEALKASDLSKDEFWESLLK